MIHSMMKNQAKPMRRIVFPAAFHNQACRYTSIQPVGSFDPKATQCEAFSSASDVETFRLNGWPFEFLTDPV